MPSILSKLLEKGVRNDILWNLLSPFANGGHALYRKRNHFIAVRKQSYFKQKFDSILKDKTVLNGPFKGMKYPSLEAAGSALFPKLLGCYEMEIQDIVENMCNYNYTEILDIGCAEGYYAIGFAQRNNNAKIFAYDIDEIARKLCYDMASLNRVSNIEIKSTFNTQDLKNFTFTGPGLIICDCEGYELELFNESCIAMLANCDLLIETHDHININISTKLKTLFYETHNVEIIKSKDDIEKAQTYSYVETDDMDLETKKVVFSEGRPAIMSWLVLKAKNRL